MKNQVWRRIVQIARDVRSLLRRPTTLLRLARYIDAQDAPSFASILRSSLPREFVDHTATRLVGRLDPSIVLEFERNGLRWRAPCGDSVTIGLLESGHWQGQAIDGLVSWMQARGFEPTSKTWLDIGANIGTTTVALAASGCRVVAVEPSPRNVSLLRFNTTSNGLTERVEIVEAAIIDGVDDAVDFTEGAAHGMGHLAVESSQSRRVPAMNIEGLLAKVGLDARQVAAVWCDVEGAEGFVIQSGAGLWSAGVPLFAELVPGHLERFTSIPTVVSLLRQHFSSFVSASDLEVLGADARERPIGELTPETIGMYGDVLLLPGKHCAAA